MRIQKIILENGMEVYINHDFKEKCINCKKEIIWAYVPLELVSLAKWNIHKCKKGGEIEVKCPSCNSILKKLKKPFKKFGYLYEYACYGCLGNAYFTKDTFLRQLKMRELGY